MRFVLLALIAAPGIASAVPVQLSHQARLLDPAGGAVTGEHDVSVRLYDSDNNVLFTEQFAGIRVEDGFFSVRLGSDEEGNPLDHTVVGAASEVGVQVGEGTELAPRSALTTNPRAVHALQADAAATAEHAVQADSATEADHALAADTAVLAELAAEADHAAAADTAILAELAAEADHAAAADTAVLAELAAEADHATEADHAAAADTALTAEHAASADTAGSASTAGNASQLGGSAASAFGSAGTFNIGLHACAWTGCMDTPTTTPCPSNKVIAAVDVAVHSSQKPRGCSGTSHEDEIRYYCCAMRVTIPTP